MLANCTRGDVLQVLRRTEILKLSSSTYYVVVVVCMLCVNKWKKGGKEYDLFCRVFRVFLKIVDLSELGSTTAGRFIPFSDGNSRGGRRHSYAATPFSCGAMIVL